MSAARKLRLLGASTLRQTTIKVLDFGLAKMGGTPTAHGDESPTLTVGQTEAGVILGTASFDDCPHERWKLTLGMTGYGQCCR
jgi:hypothetical protein